MLHVTWLARVINQFWSGFKRREFRIRNRCIFEVRLDEVMIFSRKQLGHFPESKDLKSLIHDVIAPDWDLGHDDSKA